MVRTVAAWLVYALRSRRIGLECIRTDGATISYRWVHFTKKLKSDWEGFTLYVSILQLLDYDVIDTFQFLQGSVFLTANVAFLAIPGIDPGGRLCTPAQLASYLSIITSLGSVVTGLLLPQRYITGENVVRDTSDLSPLTLHSLRSW